VVHGSLLEAEGGEKTTGKKRLHRRGCRGLFETEGSNMHSLRVGSKHLETSSGKKKEWRQGGVNTGF